MFELLVSAAHAHLLVAEHSASTAVLGDKHSVVHTNQLNLVGNSNQVYNSGPENGGAPWMVNSYDVRPTDAAGLAAEGGAGGPYACDTDGFMCKTFNTQAFDNGVNGNTSALYTNFGTNAEDSHPKGGVAGPSGGGAPSMNGSAAAARGVKCGLAQDCNGLG